MSKQELQDEKWILFLGYLRGYFEGKKGSQENKDELMSEIMTRFFKKQMIDVDEKILKKITDITDIILPEQLQSIITELMKEGYQLHNLNEVMEKKKGAGKNE